MPLSAETNTKAKRKFNETIHTDLKPHSHFNPNLAIRFWCYRLVHNHFLNLWLTKYRQESYKLKILISSNLRKNFFFLCSNRMPRNSCAVQTEWLGLGLDYQQPWGKIKETENVESFFVYDQTDQVPRELSEEFIEKYFDRYIKGGMDTKSNVRIQPKSWKKRNGKRTRGSERWYKRDWEGAVSNAGSKGGEINQIAHYHILIQCWELL